ncbi:UbiA prenyltransferase family-domain-containing protein [Mycena maculata]|uniref:4-hydroxybenzoate polyprenyltransferase, mitochondrial n=1 Tax=Mycena maculata TaxID=230809 RepID=A0AAD7K3U8_9AGAR|nr:UbiA prenyltransferase family-domain-containing protein [Mycena maculata]
MSSRNEPISKLKPRWQYYFELTRLGGFPFGTQFIFWPSAWGVGMAAYSKDLPMESFITHTVMFALGSTVLHAAACVLNDICDRHIDRKVERTKHRPLASGVVSVSGATALLFSFLSATLVMLSFANSDVFMYALVGIFPLHGLYPLMKRWTSWPQIWLGLAMGWGLFPGWISVNQNLKYDVIGVFYLGSVCWTVVYDTIYACQDRKDDLRAGVGSAAVILGSWVRPILAIFASTFIACMIYAGIHNHNGPYFFTVSVGGAALFFLWVFSTWKVDDNEDCLSKITANGNMGVIIWSGIFLDYYLK